MSPCGLFEMKFGNKAVDGGNLILTSEQLDEIGFSAAHREKFTRKFFGSAEFIKGFGRFCLWLENKSLPEALEYQGVQIRIDRVRRARQLSRDIGARAHARASGPSKGCVQNRNTGVGSSSV
jgi:hypothetical protein